VNRDDRRVDAVFAALADPTRRSVMRELARSESVTATELAESMPVSRQAVVKHLQVLARAGLARSTRDGREVHYVFTPDPLADAARWLAEEGAAWDERLDRLRTMLERS
jgi:DNA-binding transcriptional ArsR family regulator